MYSIIARPPLHPPQGHYAPLKWNTPRCHNVSLKLGRTWLRSHLLSPPANLNELYQYQCPPVASYSPWASAHVHVCTINSFTAAPRVREMSKKLGPHQLWDRCRPSYRQRGFVRRLFAVWWRTLTQQFSSSNCCRSLVKHDPSPPTVSFSCQVGTL